MTVYIPCKCCGTQFTETWLWMVCNKCGYHICLSCLGRHKGLMGTKGKNAANALSAILMGRKGLNKTD